jgi:hypothetical protein
MKELTWYDFDKLSQRSKKEFLIKVKADYKSGDRYSTLLYNRNAEYFGLEKINPSF